MNKQRYLIFEGFMLVFLTGLIASFQNDFSHGTAAFKTFASLCFVLAGFCGYLTSKKKFTKMMLAAFFCSMLGDIFLALDTSQGLLFILGVVSFAAAHLLFSTAFCSISPVSKKDIAITGAVFCILLLLLFLGSFDFKGLLPVLIGYAAIISFMMVKSLSLKNCRWPGECAAMLIMAGGVLFLLSDIILLFWLFGIGIPKEVQSLNWVVYYLAQGCLSASLNKVSEN